MEDAKKAKVLQTAIELFRLKGYSAASMQDIAEACGMAKASIYKFFASKEELFTAAFVVCHQTLLDQAGALDRVGAELNLSPKEKLRRKIELQLLYTVENHLFMIDFKELPIAANEQFIAAWKRKKAALQTWRRELLIDAYGEKIIPYIWDVVAIFRGIHIEYLSYVQQKVIALPMSELAAFIVDRMDALAEDLIRTAPKPVIDERSMPFNYLNPSDAPARQATVQQLIACMAGRIGELSKPEDEREELLKVAAMLGEQCERQPSDKTLIRVLASYLDAIPELRSHIRQLKYLLS
ncbi:TetR/AcrR family transcriptional regulator [Paenibacillus doosanensis]|uniref:DNA-binding transcriptional regulator EnvR n=1 Tax=Paenibacillus konkukensis TaxID=2020716 RepID=A0ABY4RF88_9BACL|nr:MULTISPECIES: TetR/AcrR family transcriptional regulator [Paenibacillus]MCS7460544.1 TetR/AcrR family transcriptional regulator [Paenibacillus doosanensis]UQZ81234.1 DNA-binding transcriptional regulator EnvR [Paenibacillus konkukensis]